MRYVFFIVGALFFLGLFVDPALASGNQTKDLPAYGVGEVTRVRVQMNTEEQTINAVELGIGFDSSVLQFVSSDDSDSVVSLWVEKPKSTPSSTVHFSGITPGGFSSKDASIVTLTFRALRSEVSQLNLVQSTALLNDGQGTPATLSDRSVSIEAVTASDKVADTEMPEDFTPQIITDPDLYGGRATLIFSTRDTGSGVLYYEVKEGEFGSYVRADSPYDIQHQDLDTVLYVKAVDHFGNERISVVYPQNWKPWYKPPNLIVSIIVLCLAVLLIGWFGRLRFLRR